MFLGFDWMLYLREGNICKAKLLFCNGIPQVQFYSLSKDVLWHGFTSLSGENEDIMLFLAQFEPIQVHSTGKIYDLEIGAHYRIGNSVVTLLDVYYDAELSDVFTEISVNGAKGIRSIDEFLNEARRSAE